MPKLTLISTIYALEPVIICVTRLSPSKIILLSEEGAGDKKLQSEEMIEKTFKNALEVEKKYTAVYDTVRVAKDVAELIEKEHDRGNQVIVNVSGGRKPQAFGALFGAYARNDMVQRIVYVTEEDSLMIDFPVLSFNLSETKKLILEEIQKGVSAVSQIAVTAGISKGMTYNHLRELKSMGYIADGDNGYIITDAGKIASI
ncbi:CRISPR-associated protein [Methanosarcina sp. 1.H.T.1A.1]|uniref:CRISPR-associated CARF protein Csa3 n=1 Tax=unclassified Methanosarcina TaxID=2644672 RepID=UPI000621EFA0|nr:MULTISPECIES: CRISPR-associated CARF protein Csa3 [unclassified Methanosarcina]KKH45916.1 CRISPR-associated protein [Methanosarcina sp. 1.H.A.2.2]KKH98898.1 CRISPR-associated protein [Methanosarcina sp. 1.H.T.1A.1]